MRALTLLLSLPLLTGETLSDAERAKAIQYLEQTEAKFVSTVKDLTSAQWRFKPAPDRWSIGECVEHITLTERIVLANIIKKSLSSPAEPSKFDKSKDEVVLQGMLDRSKKAKAEGEVVPSGGTEFTTPASAIQAFKQSRAETLGFLRSTQVDLRTHGANHPAFGELDAYQWTLMLAGHCERHTKQIEEVIADPKYPKTGY